MKIEAITLRELNMPLVHFFETSFGRTYTRRVMLVTIHSDGLEGWGECVAGEQPYYSEEYIDGAWDVIVRYLAPPLLGKTIASGKDVPPLLGKVREHRMAKAAMENAIWDAEAQEKNVPLWQVLGGKQREIACGVSIGIQDSHEQLLQKIETELAAGYQRIKVKVKPGWDIDVLAKIRSRWPGILLSCDANSAYTINDLPHLQQFDQFKLLMIEQPLWSDDFFFHSKLQKRLQTAICLDEAIRTARDTTAALELGAARIINIKVGRVGGFSEALAVHDSAERFNVPVWCGGMLESGVGRSHNVALSTLSNFKLPGDVSASKRYWKEDIIDPEVTVSPQGTITVSDKPGRGYEVRNDLIQQLTVKQETLRA
jgi:O-succinylbenzoate synthase